MFVLDLTTKSMTSIEYADGQIAPPVRNSHSLTKGPADSGKAYLFGGANSEGPLKDLYELDLETL